MTELHYKKGFMGWLAKVFSIIGTWGDPYEETVILPALVSLIAFRMTETQRLSDVAAVSIFIASCFLAGAWLGVAWSMTRGLRVILRGMSVGALTAAGVAATTSIAQDKQQMLSLAAPLMSLATMLFWFGHTYFSLLREIALTSEEQWQRTKPRRAWIRGAFRKAIGSDEENLTTSQLVVARLLQSLAAFVLWLLGMAAIDQKVFGMDPLDILKTPFSS